MLGIITLPTDITAQISTQASGVFTDFAPLAVLIIGILLGLFLISKVIDWLRYGSIESSEEIAARWRKAEEENDYREI